MYKQIKKWTYPAKELSISLAAPKKYRRFDALLVRRRSLALVTFFSSLPSTTIVANRGSSFTKNILSSLHLSLLSLILFCVDHSSTLSARVASYANKAFIAFSSLLYCFSTPPQTEIVNRNRSLIPLFLSSASDVL